MGEKLINLDECTINALNLLQKRKLQMPKINFKKAIVIGSGNAAITGKILFKKKNYIFATESNYLEKLNKEIDGCILISASGGKHSPIIAKDMKEKNIKTILLTNNKNAKAKKFVSKTYLFPKNKEPYTYNTSTYMGMILSKTKEDPKKIMKFIKSLKKYKLKKYKAFYIIIPERQELLKEMIKTKFDELFGPKINGRVFTYEETKHAKTVIESKKELFISLGVKNKEFGLKRLNINLPPKSDFGLIMATAYTIIGQIQSQKPAYFKNQIKKYTKKISKIFNEEIKIIS